MRKMKTNATYTKFHKIVEELKIIISEEQCIEFLPKTKTIDDSCGSATEKYLEITIRDDQISYEEKFEASRDDLVELISVLNTLNNQLR